MLSLSSLAGWEEAILASIAGATGAPEERDRQVERSGIYGEYPAVVRAYEELFVEHESSGEALKRAVFLVWRAANAAPWETGIAPLPEGTVRGVVDALGARVRRGATDAEQGWMLAWYHAELPSLLELYGATPALMSVIDTHQATEWHGVQVDRDGMRRRGQMGHYWNALVAGTR